MKRGSPWRRARVYYSVLAFLVLATAERTDGQVRLTVAPAMTRGAVEAPVTIVEFSDYQ